MHLLNDTSRLQRLKERFGIKIQGSRPLDAHKELTTLKREIATSYGENKQDLHERYHFTGRLTVTDWIDTIPVMKSRAYNRVKEIYQTDGIEALLLAFIPYKLK